mgnify:CR=1 FL=1
MNCFIINAIKNDDAKEKISFRRIELSDNLKELLNRSGAQAPIAAIVEEGKDYARVLKNEGLVKNRGVKNPHKQLSCYLLGHENAIPCINGNFTVCRQLKNGVRALLNNDGCRNGFVSIVAVSREIMRQLVAETVSESTSKAEPGKGKRPESMKAGSVEDKKAKASGAFENYKSAKTSGVREKIHSTEESGGPGTGSAGGETFARTNKSALSKAIIDLLSETEVPKALCDAFYGDSAEFRLIRQLIMLASKCDEPVLLLGETGTGKEVIARSIHEYYLSGKGKDFKNPSAPKLVTVNCGAIQDDLFETELFGYKKGAFTGAIRDKDGLWKVADGGTLFLDEIGDLHLDHQVKILRALQEGTFLPVGALKEESSHPRIIAATNRDLYSMVQTGQFREDLYYRLRIFLIRTPSLGDNPENLRTIAEKCWASITKAAGCSIAEESVKILQEHRWPGNVRELKALLSGTFSLFRDPVLRVEHLRAMLQMQGPAAPARSGEKTKDGGEAGLYKVECLRHLRRADEVVQACKVTFGGITGVKKTDPAREAGLRNLMRYRLDELETLCAQPVLFHDKEAFFMVHQLKGRLVYFLDELEMNRDRGFIQKARSEIGPLFKKVQAAVISEVNLLFG